MGVGVGVGFALWRVVAVGGVKKKQFPRGWETAFAISKVAAKRSLLFVALVLFAFSCDNVDEGVTSALLEFNNTVNQCVKSVVFTHANVYAWTVNSTALTADDVTGFSELTTKNFHTESFAM